MKSRITKEKEQALLYRLGEQDAKGEAVRRVLSRMGVQARDVTPDMLPLTLGACAGLPGFPAQAARLEEPAPEREALIMAGMDKGRIQELLNALREEGVAIRLKAVMTPSNRHWPFGRLLCELAREDAMMHPDQTP